MPNKGDCLPNDINYAGLCYNVPSGWSVTAPGFIGRNCDGLFGSKDTWDKNTYNDIASDSQDIINANAATRNYNYRDDGTSCWIDVDTIGRGTGYSANCPSGTYKDGSLCYTNCPAGWKGIAGVCWPDPACPSNTTDSGVSCTKNSFMQKITTSSTSCPSGQGTPCPNGCRNDGTSCWEDVSCNTYWDSCAWTSIFGCVGGLKTSCTGCGCIKQGVNRSCPSGYSLSGLLCYENCPAGYTNIAGVCWPQCGDSSKWTDSGVSCTKKSSIPAPIGGTIPSICGKTNGYDDQLTLGICYPNCVGFAQKNSKPYWKNYHGTTVNFCQRDAQSRSKDIKSSIGQLPYPSNYYPTSNIADISFISVDMLADTTLNNIYTTNVGCLPNIDASKLAPGTLGTALDVANKNAFTAGNKYPNNGEFVFAMGSQCDMCDSAYGKECAGSIIKGVRPALKRTEYKADPIDCCNTGANKSTDDKLTCHTDFRSNNPDRIKKCYEAKSNGMLNSSLKDMSMDQICNGPNYSSYSFCRDNYTQLPNANADLTEWNSWSNCDLECGGGNQSQTRNCNVNPTIGTQAVRNEQLQSSRGYATDLTDDPANSMDNSAQKLFIIQDNCSGQPLINTQKCNTQNCAAYAVENYRGVQLILFLIIVYLVRYFYINIMADKSVPTASPTASAS